MFDDRRMPFEKNPIGKRTRLSAGYRSYVSQQWSRRSEVIGGWRACHCRVFNYVSGSRAARAAGWAENNAICSSMSRTTGTWWADVW